MESLTAHQPIAKGYTVRLPANKDLAVLQPALQDRSIAATLCGGDMRSLSRYFHEHDATTLYRIIAYQHDDIVCGAARLHHGQIDYFVAPSHWGQGAGTALVFHMLELAFDIAHYPSVSAYCALHNLASRRILLRFGFRSLERNSPCEHLRLTEADWRRHEVQSPHKPT